jgi:DNA-binding transcriptional MerR regulator
MTGFRRPTVAGDNGTTVSHDAPPPTDEAIAAAGEQGLLFDDDVASMPDDVGYRGPTACSAAGITYRQLDYWARTGLVEPTVRTAGGSGTQRLYSFRDIVVLKVVKRLLNAGVSLQNIRKAIETLRQWGEDDLATMTLISDGTTVYECRSAEEVVDLLQGGQGVFGIAIGGAFKEIQGSLADLPASSGTVDEEPPVDVDDAEAMDELAALRARRRAG